MTKTNSAMALTIVLAVLSFSTGVSAAGRAALIVVADPGSSAELVRQTRDPSSLVHGLVRDHSAEKKLLDEILKAGKTGRA